jgi:hypothetical protein
VKIARQVQQQQRHLPAGVPDMLHQTGMMSDAGVKAAMIATAPEYLVAAA